MGSKFVKDDLDDFGVIGDADGRGDEVVKMVDMDPKLG